MGRPPPISDASKLYKRIHRLARHNADLRHSLQNFFSDGMPLTELREHPGLLAQLQPSLDKDIKLLCGFLFSDPAGKDKGKKGLIPSFIAPR